MNLLSVFNLEFDLQLHRTVIYLSEFIFIFVLINLIFFIGFINKRKARIEPILWFPIITFLVFAFWSDDYFSFGISFYKGLEEFRDPLYQYIAKISLNSYLLFRLIIWGSALCLMYITAKKFKINIGTLYYVFSIFFLMTFSYARASLGMALYFFGLSYLIVKDRPLAIRIIITIISFSIAYFAHRSLLILILISPLFLLKMSKKKVIIFLIISPIVMFMIRSYLEQIISGSISNNGDDGFTKSVNQYAKLETEIDFNWKWRLVTTIQFWGYYISIAYIFFKLYFSKIKIKITSEINSLLTITFFIILIAVSIMFVAGDKLFGLWLVAYRYLYMAGIPLVIIISYMYQNKCIGNKQLHFIFLICPILYSELYLIGKIITLMFIK